MMRRISLTCILFTVLCATALVSLPLEEAVEKFRGRMYRLERLTGVISWTALDGQTYSGSFKYLGPDKIYVKFSSPSEKILISNGKTLWIYHPGNKTCGIQELEKGTTSGGIAGLVSGYTSGIASEADFGYTIKLKNDERLYREIILSLDRTYLLKGAVFKRDDGRIISFSISDVSDSAAVSPKLFNFKIPKGVQVVKNPMNML
jgi:outer membrane lipoprotein carrier protein